jgi:hypothetical protein
MTTTTATDTTISDNATPTTVATTAVLMPLRLGESVNKTDNIATYSKPSVFVLSLGHILVIACYAIN